MAKVSSSPLPVSWIHLCVSRRSSFSSLAILMEDKLLRMRLENFASNKYMPQPTIMPSPCIIGNGRSEEHTPELQSLMRISYAVFCLQQKKTHNTKEYH